MAGAYADAPSRRMATDVDGTVGVYNIIGGASTALSGANMTALNNEDESTGPIVGITTSIYRWCYLFPEAREIDGVFAATGSTSGTQPTLGIFATSGDSTNGIDGSWVTAVANMPEYSSVYSNFRDNITSTAVATEKAVRQEMVPTTSGNNKSMKALHVYGVISPSETPDRILFLDTLAADAVFTKVLDFGDVPRGQTQTRTFKIKNNSSTYTINTIQVTAEDLYLNAGGWYTFGIDDVTYVATYAAGNLGTGATLLLYMKQIIPDGETLGVQTGRIKVSHASLT